MNIFSQKGIVALSLMVAAGAAHAGTVISTNLPAGTSIVNIDARNDGAGNYGSGQNQWYQPFAVNGHLLSLTVDPGTYTFQTVNPKDASQLFPTLDSTQLSQIYTAWTYNNPWVTDYFVFDSSAAQNWSEPELFSGAIGGRIPNFGSTPGWNGGGWNSADQAYSALVNGGTSSKIYTGGRFTGTEQSSYTFANTTTLIFAIPDNGLYDNGGGVSVVVSKFNAVPEPASMTVLATMIGGLLVRRRKNK